MNCSRCGAEVQPSWKACPSCGLALAPTTPVQALLSGDVTEYDLVKEALGGEYELLEELGRGGMAIVYRARERQLDREVAVKVLPMSLAFDAEFVERFEREARTAAQLEHPNIIPIYRVGQSGRISYFVMKYLRGKSLSQLTAERGKMSPAEIRKLLIEAARALGYAAERGIVHRDVKPDNFILDEFGSCVVTDFGIAKAMSGKKLTGTGMSIGTPHYMSPEQARAQPLDGRSDLYSLGVVAYQCLTGTVPYDGEDSFAIGYAHIMEPIPVPTLASAEERDLYRIITRMIAKDPKDRFQNCAELIMALEGQPLPSLRPAPRTQGQSPPTITTQPTTPLPSVTTGTARSHIVTTSARRPVVKRGGAAQPQRSGGAGWLFFLLLLIGGGGVWAAYYFQVGPFAPPLDAAARPAQDTLFPRPVLSAIDSGFSIGDSGATGNDTTSAAALDTVTPTPPSPPVQAPPTVPVNRPPPRDSGAIRIRGLPSGSGVLIDGEPALRALTRLPIGDHVIAITAPRHNFYTDTVAVRVGEVVEYQPVLTKVGEPDQGRQAPIITRRKADCDEPSQGYNRNNVCFDVRPRPVGPTFVRIPASWNSLPEASQLLVKVSPEGRTLVVRSLRPSDNREFERMARQFAANIDWHPATKAGQPVTGWTPWQFVPLRQ